MRTSWVAWGRKHKLLAVLIPAVLVVLAGGIAVASSGGGGKGPAASSGAGTGIVASSGAAKGDGAQVGGAISGSSRGVGKPDSVGGKAVHAALQAPVTRGAKWVTGRGGKLLDAVTADMGKVSGDERTGKKSAAKSAGAKLAAAAGAALNGPMPPVDARIYRSALKDFEQIGTDAARGKFRAASSLLAPASLGIVQVTAAVNQPAPVNPRAPVSGPNS